MDETILLLNKMMDGASMRHRVLANNLANANTPGFKRQDVKFRDALASALDSGMRLNLKSAQPEVYEDLIQPSRPDGNTVSPHVEMGLMNENQVLYQFSAQAIQSKFARLKSAIKGQ